MAFFSKRLGGSVLALTLAATALAGPVTAQDLFGATDRTLEGEVSFSAARPRAPIHAGSEVVISGEGFRPGQTVRLLYGAHPLPGGVQTADAEGAFEARLRVPEDATVGIHPILVVSEAPYTASVAELKVSPDIPLSGAEDFVIETAQLVNSLYQSAYSARNDAVFVTAAVGRPPVRDSTLLRLDADTLEVEASITPAEAPRRQGRNGEMTDGGLYAVYGVGVDDVNGNVWVSNTRQDTVAVYRQSDLSLVRQFEPGTVNHARDVVMDAELGKIYVSATFTPEVVVFDAASTDERSRIAVQSGVRGETFSVASLSFDQQAHRLYVVSLSTSEVAVIDTRTDTVLNVFPVPGARGVIGVSHDPQTDRIFVAAQGTDNLVILDGASGAVIADTPVGAGALNVAFDPQSRLAYVVSRGAGTVTVLDVEGNIVANLGPAPLANHVTLDGQGGVFAVNKAADENDPLGNRILHIRPRP